MKHLKYKFIPSQLTISAMVIVLLCLFTATSHGALVNGGFSVNDSAATGFGWSTKGTVIVSNGQVVLAEGDSFMAGLEQSFALSGDITALKFTFTGLDLVANNEGDPVDALEVRLLNAANDSSLVSVVSTISGTDSFFNLQQTGQVHFSSQVTVPDNTGSGHSWSPSQSVTITLDLSGITTDKQAILAFNLLGFGRAASSVTLDAVWLVGPPPALLNDSVVMNEDIPVGIDVLANDYDVGGVLDHSSLIIAANGPDHGTAIVNVSTGIITYTPAENYFGPDRFSYRVSDFDAVVLDPAVVNITVNPVNDAPVITSSPVTSVAESSMYSYTFAAHDVDQGDTVTLISLVKPSWLNFNETTGQLSGVPSSNDIGNHDIVLRADDGGKHTQQSFVLTVDDVNEAPVITGQNSLSTIEDTPITVLLTDLQVTDPDSVFPGAFTLIIMPGDHYSFFESVVTPDNEFSGDLTVLVKVHDGANDSNVFNLQITVSQVEDPPVADAGGNLSVAEGSLVTLDGSGSYDGEGDIAFYSWLQLMGRGVDLSGTTISQPTFTAPQVDADNELLAFRLTVTDRAGLTDNDTITVLVFNKILFGDMNNDSRVGLADAILPLRLLAGLPVSGLSLTPESDFNQDGRIGLVEVFHVMQVVAGIKQKPDLDDDRDGYTDLQGDCNDYNSTVYPGAVEVCGDGIDQNCDGLDLICGPEDIDNDGDGFTENQGDCLDSNAAIHPGAFDICGDGIDQDCNDGDAPCIPENIDDDGDGYTENQGDCLDTDEDVYPDAVEICSDGIDQDCSGADLICPADIDDDGDGYTENQGDCLDNDSGVHPGAVENPGNGKDDDCNPATLDSDLDGDGRDALSDCNDSNSSVYLALSGFADLDHDNYTVGGPLSFCTAGTLPVGYRAAASEVADCNDSNSAIFAMMAGYLDQDNDSYTVGNILQFCTGGSLPTGYRADQSGVADCNDSAYAVNPGAAEIPYNGVDDDCNAATTDDDLDGDGHPAAMDCNDANDSLYVLLSGYLDLDNDTYTTGSAVPFCTGGTLPAGYRSAPSGVQDCNDGSGLVNPGRTEIVYNGVDDDCNPATRDDDLDSDGHVLASDCNDSNSGVFVLLSGYLDVDNDSYIVGSAVQFCTGGSLPVGYRAIQSEIQDCNDNIGLVNPGQTEIVYNGLDDDCNPGTRDDDLDNDGHVLASDCNDSNSVLYALLTGYLDQDNDSYTTGEAVQFCTGGSLPIGYRSAASGVQDCNDSRSLVNPGRTEIIYNGLDDDCDAGTRDDDLDNDGHLLASDCNDSNSGVYAPLTGYLDQDNDSYTVGDVVNFCTTALPAGYRAVESGSDCNDTNSSIHPTANDSCGDGIDQDCSGSDAVCSGPTCDRNGFTAGGTVSTYFFPQGSMLIYNATSTNDSPHNILEVEMFGSRGAQLIPQTYNILADTNFGTSPIAVLANAVCTLPSCEKMFLANGGVLTITAIGTSTGSRFTGTLSNATFREVTIDPQTHMSTPVNGGQTWCISSYSFDGTVAPPPQPPTTDNDHDGVPLGADCNDSNAAVYPGATEICGDGIDQDCDGIDPSCSTFSNALNMNFSLIPAGTFNMGSPADEPGRVADETLHQVTLTHPFYMMTTEVTQRQWMTVMGNDNNPSRFAIGDNYPVENVTWDAAQEYISALNAMGIGAYRLPTEAEWEYASRAGSSTAFANGPIVELYQNDPYLNAIGWYFTQPTQPVAQKQANGWGLYDMHGNVYEWTHDWNDSYPTGSVIDPTGPDSGPAKILRGGSWDSFALDCRSAYRGPDPNSVDFGANYFGEAGFRLVKDINSDQLCSGGAIQQNDSVQLISTNSDSNDGFDFSIGQVAHYLIVWSDPPVAYWNGADFELEGNLIFLPPGVLIRDLGLASLTTTYSVPLFGYSGYPGFSQGVQLGHVYALRLADGTYAAIQFSETMVAVNGDDSEPYRATFAYKYQPNSTYPTCLKP